MRDDDKIQVLGNVPLFSILGASELKSLAAIVTERNFTTGETIFFEGDSPDWFYIVADGMVEILKHSSAGKDFVITLLPANEILGEVAIFDGAPYPASARK